MQYDNTSHRWHLTIEDTREIIENIESVYGSREKAERELKAQSRSVYYWIFNRIPTQNKDIVEYTLAKDSRIQKDLKEVLIAQLEYDLKTGGSAIDKQSGIDFKNNSQMPRSRIAESQISIQAEQILENAGVDFN